jgi:hypothetical protein
MLNPLLTDERYDEMIVEAMMYQPMCNELKIGVRRAKNIDNQIYELLEQLEEIYSVKL